MVDEDDDDLESISDPVIQSEPIRIVPSRKYVHRLPPLGKDHITITDTEGRRVFLPIEKASEDVSVFFKTSISFLMATLAIVRQYMSRNIKNCIDCSDNFNYVLLSLSRGKYIFYDNLPCIVVRGIYFFLIHI